MWQFSTGVIASATHQVSWNVWVVSSDVVRSKFDHGNMVITSHFDVRSMWDACGDWLSVTDGWLGNSKDLMLMWHCSTNVYLVWLQFHTGRDRSVSVRIWRKTTVFGSVQFGFLKVLWSMVARRCSQSRLVFAKTHTPLHGFVVDLLYNKLYNKSTTNLCKWSLGFSARSDWYLSWQSAGAPCGPKSLRWLHSPQSSGYTRTYFDTVVGTFSVTCGLICRI